MPQHTLTVPEVMKRLGISDSTCRRLLRNGVLKEAGRDAGNRILIDPQSVDAAAVAMGRADLAGSEVRKDVSNSLAKIDETVSDTIAGFAEIIRSQEERLIELAQELGAAKAEARMITSQVERDKSQAEVNSQRIVTLEQELAQAQREITELRARPSDIPADKSPSHDIEGSITHRIRKLFGGD